jgi:PAS domain S-box-containing protein
MKTLSLRTRILIPLALAILALLATFVFSLFRFQHRHMINDVTGKLESVKELFMGQLAADASMMGAVLDVILRDEQLEAALKAKDRRALLEPTQTLFEQLRSERGITHLYFTGPDRINILRVHKPDIHGDKINRFTTLEAEKTGNPSYGIELGPLGTFTLRAVEPWYDGEQLIGYVELGEEIEHLTHRLHDILGVEVYVAIEKKYLDRENWETGMRMLGRTAEWDRFASVVMIDQTLNVFPESLGKFLAEERHTSMVTDVDVSLNDRRYRSRFIHLEDAGGRQVGDMVVMTDVTGLVSYLHATVFIIGMICLTMGGLLFMFFYVFVGRVEEQMATASEELIRVNKAVESASDAVIMLNLSGQPFYQNKASMDLFGYSVEEIKTGGGLSILHADQEVAHQVFDTIAKGRAWRGEVEMRTREGNSIAVSLRADAIRGETGRIVGFIGIHTDISERKRAEEALRKTKDQAEAASRAKSDFLANVSHEIRTPMNAIIGMTELALSTQLTTEQQDYLRTVQASADSLLSLLNLILDLSKIEAGQLELDEIDFDLRTTLENAADMLAVRAEEAGLELTCHIKPGVPVALVGDPVRLRQIIINLAANAVKFTQEGQVTISVEAQKEEDSSAFLHFTVSDTGIGIPPDKIETIFESFRQADASTTRKYGGTGLGLAISKQLVEMMGGEIWVESELEKGSTFHFTARFELGRREAREGLRIRDVDLAGVPVLILDDNPTNRLVLKEMTSSWGLESFEAADESETLAMLDKAFKVGKPYRVLLLDSQLSGKDGFEVANRVKESPYGASLKIILLTSVGRKGDAAQCAKFGISGYLTKPVKQSDLLNAIMMALGHAVDEKAPLITRYAIQEAQRRLGVLLVEDNPVNQKVAATMLEKRGHRVVVASNGREALEALDKERIDLILMDLQMPEMDGFEATELIREREKVGGGHIPIVAMTAHAMKGDRQRCLEAGMDDYISKPISEANLFSVIENLAHRSQDKEKKSHPPSKYLESPAEDIFDLSKAMSALDGDRALFEEIANLFLEDATNKIAKLREGVDRGDGSAVAQAAHTLKGSVGYFGAKRTFDAVCRLELLGKNGTWPEAEAAQSELEREFKTLEVAMKRALPE